MRRESGSEYILIEDSKLMGLCWKLACAESSSVRIFPTPQEFLESPEILSLGPESIFVVDMDFAGLDAMNGIEFAETLRSRGLKNPIHLYSGFDALIPKHLIELGIVNGVHSKDLSPQQLICKIQGLN